MHNVISKNVLFPALSNTNSSWLFKKKVEYDHLLGIIRNNCLSMKTLKNKYNNNNLWAAAKSKPSNDAAIDLIYIQTEAATTNCKFGRLRLLLSFKSGWVVPRVESKP